jgi:hypothetical protein
MRHRGAIGVPGAIDAGYRIPAGDRIQTGVSGPDDLNDSIAEPLRLASRVLIAGTW